MGRLLAIAVTGLIAGVVNTVAGGGSLLTFPALLGLGLSPLSANVTNTVGLVVGSFGGISGYRREVRSQRQALPGLLIPVVAGALLGTLLLLTLPGSVFGAVVPVLILIACALLVLQPWLLHHVQGSRHQGRSPILMLLLVPTSAYGAYFGAGLGVMTLALLGSFLDQPMPRLNALKLVFAAAINSLAAVIFAVTAPVVWPDALVLAVSSTAGALLISPVARRLPGTPLRIAVVVVGTAVAIRLLIGG